MWWSAGTGSPQDVTVENVGSVIRKTSVVMVGEDEMDFVDGRWVDGWWWTRLCGESMNAEKIAEKAEKVGEPRHVGRKGVPTEVTVLYNSGGNRSGGQQVFFTSSSDIFLDLFQV